MKITKKFFVEGLLSSLFCLMSVNATQAQERRFYDPLKEQAIQGRLSVLKQEDGYHRLPSAVKSEVRPPVWSLGTNAAGLFVDFMTEADTIQVRYKVKGALNMPHMPTIGVSGVDLYAFHKDRSSWEWAFGQYKFGDKNDTIVYNYNNIGSSKNKVYRLYLPLYNTVEFLEIGVNPKYSLTFKEDKTKPIVVYGTSIAQGACATRPGLAWTNIVGRNLKRKVINLAFSGNGRLEQPILNLMNGEDAAVYVLDCIPNLALTPSRSAKQLDSLIRNAVTFLRRQHPSTPIVLLQHSSAFTDGFLNKHTMAEYGASSEVAINTYNDLISRGTKNLYLIKAKDIGFDIESTVDYAHPNDIGMMKLAEAYTKLLQKILSQQQSE